MSQPGDPPDAAPDGERAAYTFPIVGVGASAGGLVATTELLQHLGPHPGVGIVTVHHLSPTHASSLVDILGRATPLPVHLAADDMRVEQNHVYVMPPNAGLLLEGGRLRLTPRLEQAGLHLPIDQFFESLAENAQQLAIGVLLSGSGSDGSAGVRAIKAAGGVIFAQDESAEYRSNRSSCLERTSVDTRSSGRAPANIQGAFERTSARRGSGPISSSRVRAIRFTGRSVRSASSRVTTRRAIRPSAEWT